MTSTRTAPRLLTLGAALVLFAAACNNGSGASTAPTAAAGNMDALIAAAKTEGALNVIALPHDWCNYGGMIDGFKAKYAGITVNENLPDGGSGDEIEAIKTNKGQTGPAGAGRHRRRHRLRRQHQDGQARPAVQGRDLGHDRQQVSRIPTATGTATTAAS